jgi:hypothetical protein
VRSNSRSPTPTVVSCRSGRSSLAVTAGIDRIVYAATADDVPTLDGSSTSDHASVLAAMQRQLRSCDRGRLVHVPVDGADAPFRRHLIRNPVDGDGAS